MKLLKKIKSKSDYDRMNDVLINRILDKKPITDNPMRDGFAISIISFDHKTLSDTLINPKENKKPRYLDGTMQKLEVAIEWLMENDDFICKLL